MDTLDGYLHQVKKRAVSDLWPGVRIRFLWCLAFSLVIVIQFLHVTVWLAELSYIFLFIPGARVWNADLRQQTALRSSLWCKDLTLRHFVVSSTSVRRAREINWKSFCVVLCCCVQYAEIYTELRIFANSFNLLVSFEENCCRIILTTSRSSWWTCSITRHVWMMISAFYKWWLRSCTQGTWTIAKKIRRCAIASIVGRKWFTNTKTTRRTIGS